MTTPPLWNFSENSSFLEGVGFPYSWTEAKIFNMDQVTTCHGIFQVLENSMGSCMFNPWKFPGPGNFHGVGHGNFHGPKNWHFVPW